MAPVSQRAKQEGQRQWILPKADPMRYFVPTTTHMHTPATYTSANIITTGSSSGLDVSLGR